MTLFLQKTDIHRLEIIVEEGIWTNECYLFGTLEYGENKRPPFPPKCEYLGPNKHDLLQNHGHADFTKVDPFSRLLL